jgi:2'-5' RNA ligase
LERAIRAFFALELGAAARRRAVAAIDALRGAPGGDDVRWARGETLHVTLRFLGATDPADVPQLVRAVSDATRAIAPFELALGALDAFPPRRPRVVALGLEPAAAVAALAAAVERGVAAAGLPPEQRAFHPHVTLGRARRERRIPRELLEEESLRRVTASVTAPGDAWDVVETVLFRSELSPTGARYTPLDRVPLGARGGPLHP